MTVLSAHQLSLQHAGKAILNGITLEACSGQFVAVIGPNGAGKSTLLALLAGLRKASSGEVRWDGAPIASFPLSELAKHRAYLPQNARSEWPISVEYLVLLGLTPHLPAFGAIPDTLASKVEAALVLADLWDKRAQDVTTLSGGELSRAMLARALVSDPKVMLVDEPMAGLDPRHALDAMSILHARAHQGALVMASLHDLTLAARYASHCALIDEGRLVSFGPCAEVLTDERLSAVFRIPTQVIDVATPQAQVIFQG